jgi:hypothetical protein
MSWNMTLPRKKILAFVIGCILGFGLLVYEPLLASMPAYAVRVIMFPASIGGLSISDAILHPICKDGPYICRGLGLDGGPLAWVELTGILGGMMIGYGLLFLLIYILYLKLKRGTKK